MTGAPLDLYQTGTWAWKLPLKDGRTLQTRVIDPVAACASKTRKQAIARLRATFDSQKLDVVIKRQKFGEFLTLVERGLQARERNRKRKVTAQQARKAGAVAAE